MGFIFESKRLLGLSFHLRNAVQPMATRPTTAAATMMPTRAPLLRPLLVDEDESAPEDADLLADAVVRVTDVIVFVREVEVVDEVAEVVICEMVVGVSSMMVVEVVVGVELVVVVEVVVVDEVVELLEVCESVI